MILCNRIFQRAMEIQELRDFRFSNFALKVRRRTQSKLKSFGAGRDSVRALSASIFAFCFRKQVFSRRVNPENKYAFKPCLCGYTCRLEAAITHGCAAGHCLAVFFCLWPTMAGGRPMWSGKSIY